MLQNPSGESKRAVQEVADVLLDQHGKLQGNGRTKLGLMDRLS